MAGIDSYTKLLLHCDGIDGSTTFTDASLFLHGNATVNGQAQVDTAQQKFGTGSLLLDGTTDWLQYGNHNDWHFHGNDFTIDFWVRFNALPATSKYAFFFSQGANSTNGNQFYLYNNASTYEWRFAAVAGGAWTLGFAVSTTLSLNTWYHIAVTRNGSNFRIFQDGIQVGSTYVSALPLTDLGNFHITYLGLEQGGLAKTTPNGWIDEYRLSNGVARWITDFIPPTEEYSAHETKTILSDAKIKVEDIQSEIDSDAKVIDRYQPTINSDAFILIHNHQTITSDATIKIEDIQKTIQSDALITSIVQKDILSDAKIKVFNIQEDILSDALISIHHHESILSDAKIFAIGVQQTILSNAKIVIEVLYNINNKIRTIKQVLSDVTNKVNTVIQVLSDINNVINFVNSIISDVTNDFRTQKLTLNNVTNDVRFLATWQKAVDNSLQSLGKSYIKVYIASVEQTDVDVDSINISKDLNTVHTASFDLGRAYDSTKPTLESLVEIKYHIWTLYEGYISEIAPSESPESMTIRCQNKNWLDDRTNKYFFVGHKPTDDKEKYYDKINEALSTEFSLNLGIGDFVPQTINCFARGQSEILTDLITSCGNYGWFYDVDESKKIWIAGEGAVVEIQKQALGTNLGLYQLLDHNFNEDSLNIINKYRVQMGDKVIRKFNATGGSRTYTGFNYSSFSGFLRPAWDSFYEKQCQDSADGYGWDYPEPGYEDEYGEVFKKYYIPYLDQKLSSWSDRYPPRIDVHSPGGYYYTHIDEITEGFTIDYEKRTITFNKPIYLWKTNTYGEITAVRAPLLKLFLFKKNYYTVTQTPTDDPETDISNPLMFFTDKMGSYPVTILKDLNLSNLSIQEGYTYVDEEGVTQVIPSWDDTDFARDYANWQLSKSCDKKITGNINLTLDTICFYNLDLTKRIYIEGITEEPMNITSMSYNMSDFTVTLTLENSRGYKLTVSLQNRGE